MDERDARELNTDELIRLIEQDETTDKIKVLSKATPIEYARSRGIAPQKVYYAIRTGKLDKEECVCGRGVVDVGAADAIFGGGEWHKEEEDVEED
jgi:hypothetical protein